MDTLILDVRHLCTFSKVVPMSTIFISILTIFCFSLEECRALNTRWIILLLSLTICIYRISSYSFRGNYSFLTLEIQRSQYIRPKVTVHKGAETVQGRELFKGGNYMRKYGIYFLLEFYYLRDDFLQWSLRV